MDSYVGLWVTGLDFSGELIQGICTADDGTTINVACYVDGIDFPRKNGPRAKAVVIRDESKMGRPQRDFIITVRNELANFYDGLLP